MLFHRDEHSHSRTHTIDASLSPLYEWARHTRKLQTPKTQYTHTHTKRKRNSTEKLILLKNRNQHFPFPNSKCSYNLRETIDQIGANVRCEHKSEIAIKHTRYFYFDFCRTVFVNNKHQKFINSCITQRTHYRTINRMCRGVNNNTRIESNRVCTLYNCEAHSRCLLNWLRLPFSIQQIANC